MLALSRRASQASRFSSSARTRGQSSSVTENIATSRNPGPSARLECLRRIPSNVAPDGGDRAPRLLVARVGLELRRASRRAPRTRARAAAASRSGSGACRATARRTRCARSRCGRRRGRCRGSSTSRRRRRRSSTANGRRVPAAASLSPARARRRASSRRSPGPASGNAAGSAAIAAASPSRWCVGERLQAHVAAREHGRLRALHVPAPPRARGRAARPAAGRSCAPRRPCRRRSRAG